MLWSGGRRTRPDQVTVNIERPSLNSRRISGSIIVDKPIEDVWLVLTDYDRLSDYVPNLTQSRQVPSPTGGIRLFQEGAQQIVGFDFRASLVMDMEEHYGDPDDKLAMRKIKFKLVDSAMFTDFSGEWRLQFNSRIVNKGAGPGQEKYTYSTKVFYMVNIRPKGVVPVVALEWQISEEVPNNLAAVKRTAEVMDSAFFDARQQAMDARQLRSGVYISGYSQASATAAAVAAVSAANVALTTQQPVLQQQQQRYPLPPDQSAAGVDSNGWETDETLEAYIQKISANRK
ncbi:hypothetical protein JKP88DRAFT_192472 [Tribonema minus]|uniref:Coenzyme Q-binding protein COQ10 START domain-containing protein n=1 Tax=Tribonema minus TaxID=303371 RepID=A0A835ZJC3_9STRA|nr:hypothetical protein JKP88DRAFT_192472 [Tribonema minus]